jgi:hypothetical protein
MRDPDSHRRCKCCGARVASGFFHRVGVAIANPTRECAVRIVEVLTCRSRYCVSRRGEIAQRCTPSLASTLAAIAGL